MKKMIALLLVLTFALGLSACGKVSELPPLPTAEAGETPAPQPLPPEPTEEPVIPDDSIGSVIVTLRKTELEAYDPQNGQTLILSFSYDTPTVVIESNPAAAERINEHTGLLADMFYTGEDYGEGYGTGYNNLLTEAEDNYLFWSESSAEIANYEYTADQSVSVLRNDGRVLTLSYNSYSYTGGAHGGSVLRVYNYDPASGALLTLDDLSADPEALRTAVTEKLLALAREDAEIREAIDGFVTEEELPEALAALLREGSWYLDYDGLVVFSDQYEISSYAAGMVSFRIPYEELRGVLDKRLIPAEPRSEGGLRALHAEEMTDGSMPILDMLRAFESGQTVYLAAEGTLSDVSIARVEYSGGFYETAQLWSCSEMENAAVQLVTVIPDGMPNLRITWRDASGVQTRYLSQSGLDGSLILADADIEAVG